MSTSTAITFAAFWSLVALTASSADRRALLRARSPREWVLDGCGLLVQGALVPIVGVGLLSTLYAHAWPALRHAWHLPWLIAFALAFVAVDYLYYWNHRLLHTGALWSIHSVHHTARTMDVLVTSRNTVWTSALIVYLWAGSWFAYALDDPSGYLAGAGLTAALDLARHSPLRLPRLVERVLGSILVLPRDHALHHANIDVCGNYGANFALWDRLHGTYVGDRPVPVSLGIASELLPRTEPILAPAPGESSG